MRKFFAAALLLLSAAGFAQETYKKPSREILDVLHAPVTPLVSVSPDRRGVILLRSRPHPPVADLAQPMLRLAGLRINPRTNGLHSRPYYAGLTLKKIGGGPETQITLPPTPRVYSLEWSPDSKHVAFLNAADSATELWIGETATGQAHKIGKVAISAITGDAVRWMPDSRTVLAQVVPAGRGRPPAAPPVPGGPTVQESSGKTAGTGTFEDLLQNPHDEALFEYYATAQLALVDTVTGRLTSVGQPAIFETNTPAPDAQHVLVARTHRPFSYIYTHASFPREIEVWDLNGKLLHKLASLPLADSVSLDGVRTGPRSYAWKPTEPATLVWVEALDGGDPKRKVPHRDRVLMSKAPFAGEPVELLKLEHRFMGLQWVENGGPGIISEYDRARRWTRTFLLDGPAPRQLFSRSIRDAYRNPGSFVLRLLPSGHTAVMRSGRSLYLGGEGASAEGARPFLDRLDLATLKTERLFRSDASAYDEVEAVLSDDASRLLIRHESPADPPNYFVVAGQARTALTHFPDPAPQLRRIKKQLVKYQRADGVRLSFILYLPPDYREGTRLPTVMWAYPREYNDAATAGQISGSTQRFTSIRGTSHLFFLLRGYAILDNAALPVVGDFETVNNTYVEQIVAGAKSAIDKATEMGVTDPQRVGVGGHSYGAFMTANLLAHSGLFRAGIARSGAYNRTLTPFGFQSERRTLWEAPEIYLKMSPFLYAHKIKEPLLLIHGEADNNMGTFPIQSERMYQAVRGNGGTVRLVMLPHESHGYAGRESVEHTLAEMIGWFDRYVASTSLSTRIR